MKMNDLLRKPTSGRR